MKITCYTPPEMGLAADELSRGATWLLRVVLERRFGMHPVPVRLCGTIDEVCRIAKFAVDHYKRNDEFPDEIRNLANGDNYTYACSGSIIGFDVVAFDADGVRITVDPQSVVQIDEDEDE